MPVFCSSEIWPIIREYERTTTAVIHGYVQPRVAYYLSSLQKALKQVGVLAEPMVTKSNGGVMTAELGKQDCLQMLLSGTAAGVIGAGFAARQAGLNQVMSLDIGGTSADVAIIIDGKPSYGTGEIVGEFPIYIPTVSVSSIGDGGGSIAKVDEFGTLTVGPESAGSTPGPACYGRGGTRPTMTDAFAVCGIIGHGNIGYDAVSVDVEKARAAVGTIAGKLDRGLEQSAEAIIQVAVSGMYREVGKLAGRTVYDGATLKSFEPAPYVMGIGKIDGRPVAVGGEDYTIRAGTGFGSDRRKGGQGGFIEDLAYEYRIPLVNFVDGTGGTVNTVKRKGYTVVPGYGFDGFERSVDLLGVVPVVSAVMGTVAGGPAGRALLAHWTIMVRGTSQIFAAGPPVVERAFGKKVTKEELGGAKVAADVAGTIDNVAADEAEALAQIRRFLSYMPTNVWEPAPVARIDDPVDRMDQGLLDIIPRNERSPYNMRKLIGMVVDRGSEFEIQPGFGRAVIVVLARMDGYPIGIIANNPMFGGIVDAKASRKQAHFIELCDSFNIPLMFVVDVPGLLIGPESEADAIMRFGLSPRYLLGQVNVPVFTLLVRKCYGVAGGSTIDRRGLNFKIAWPSAHWGSLPIEGGVKAAYKREIESAAVWEREIRENLNAAGWYSGDEHIHGNYRGEQITRPEDNFLVMRGEDLNVANLMVSNSDGGFVHDESYFTAAPHPLSTREHMFQWNQEIRPRFQIDG